MTRHLPEFTLVIASLSLLAACGGSGSGDSSAPSTPSIPPTISISGPTNAVVGDAVDFAVASPTGHAIGKSQAYHSSLSVLTRRLSALMLPLQVALISP